MLKRLLAAQLAFEENPGLSKLYVTQDGECFPASNDANVHHISGGFNQEPLDVNREGLDEAILRYSEEKPEKPKLTKADKIAAITAATSAEELGAIEIANNEPKEVKKAYEVKMAELSK
jgi:hypothetical protein